jgi:hypothetical protein
VAITVLFEEILLDEVGETPLKRVPSDIEDVCYYGVMGRV